MGFGVLHATRVLAQLSPSFDNSAGVHVWPGVSAVVAAAPSCSPCPQDGQARLSSFLRKLSLKVLQLALKGTESPKELKGITSRLRDLTCQVRIENGIEPYAPEGEGEREGEAEEERGQGEREKEKPGQPLPTRRERGRGRGSSVLDACRLPSSDRTATCRDRRRQGARIRCRFRADDLWPLIMMWKR